MSHRKRIKTRFLSISHSVLSNGDVLGSGNYGGQRLLQISNKIIHVLNTYREPNHLLGDSHLLAVLGRDHRMGCEHRQGDQGFNSAQAGRQRRRFISSGLSNSGFN